MLITSAMATLGTLSGLGPFSRGTPNESLLLLQAYLCVKMVVMLTLAAEVGARTVRASPRDFLPFAFDQFRQADSSITREHGGLGLGLAISRDLVHLHGETITAANRPQGGALFTVRLPSSRAARDSRMDDPVGIGDQ